MAITPRGKPRVYLDTSIPSAYWDDREPGRMSRTREFWQQLPSYEVFVSAMTIADVERHPDAPRRAELLGLLRPFAVATVHGVGILVSWNFRHMVRLPTRQLLAAINPLLGYPVPQIVLPLEV